MLMRALGTELACQLGMREIILAVGAASFIITFALLCVFVGAAWSKKPNKSQYHL